MLDKTFRDLQNLNPWWDDYKFRFQVIKRPFYLTNLLSKNRLIKILIGARRTGKTSLLKNIINHFLDHRVPNLNLIFLTSDLISLQRQGIKEVLDAIYQKHLLKASQKVFIFIDEIQEIPNWQQDLKFFYDHYPISFFISGSSSLILSKQTAKLTGRFLLTQVLTLSFSEYLNFKNISPKNNPTAFLEEYLQTGGYPEYVLNKEPQYLFEVVESTLYRELLTHYGIRNPGYLKELFSYLADKITNYVSANTIKKNLGVSDQTAKFYLQYLQDVYLIFPLYKAGRSYKITKSSVPKYYFNDTGILYLFAQNPRIGHLVENAVFLQLLRQTKLKQRPDLFYEIKNNVEIDFVLNKNASYECKYREDLGQKDLEKYETMVEPVKFITKNLQKNFAEILPQHQQIPLWKFLLSCPSTNA